MSVLSKDYVIIDLETTGLDLNRDEIIEIAGVKVSRGAVVEEFSTFVSCSRPLSAEISDLTGITNEMLIGQPTIEEILDDFTDFVKGCELVAHNAEFDSSFLHKYWPDERVWLDTIVLAQIAFPTEPSYSMTNLVVSLGIENKQAHRAISDARAEAELFLRIDRKLSDIPASAKNDIMQLLEGDATPTGLLLREKCADAAAVKQEEPKQERQLRKRVIDDEYQMDISQLADFLGADSKYQHRIPGFEARPPQLKLSTAVGEAFNNRQILLAEAGTGTGKSLAYLLPAAIFSEGSGRQIAISTHTRNLQEQLLNKDIPMLSKLLDRPVAAAVLKGRSNYLCRRLYRYHLNQPSDKMRYFMMRVAVWKSQTKTGDGGELSLTSYDRWKWQRICASKDNCTDFCPFAKRNSCMVQRARFKAADADILILNHSLLIANAAIEKGFLPELPFLIIDEAQHLEHAAEDQLSAKIDVFEILNVLSRLKRKEKNRVIGAIALLQKYVTEHMEGSLSATAEKMLDDLEQRIEVVMTAAEQFFQYLNVFFSNDLKKQTFFPAKIRLRPYHCSSADWPLLVQFGETLASELSGLSAQCFKLMDLILGFAREEDELGRPAGVDELQASANASRDLAGTLLSSLNQQDDDFVIWVEYADKDKKPSLNMAPIEIGHLLHDCLYQSAESIIFTSATLAAGKDFGYYKQHHGLDLLREQPRELVLSSPFHYSDQAVFTIVNDLPDWSKCSEVEAIDKLASALIKLIGASAGRALVLFTSHYQLKAVYRAIKEPLSEKGITVLAHGISGDPSSLLHRLKQEEHCCILGANSFWEGVDVIGDALSLVVIVRLPFWPPNTPVSACRMERLEAEGRSSFNDLSLPQALIRFKQGFGRLIRSDIDQGVFCVLDRRLIEKNYGRRFISSLPDMRRIVGSVDEIADTIKNWLK